MNTESSSNDEKSSLSSILMWALKVEFRSIRKNPELFALFWFFSVPKHICRIFIRKLKKILRYAKRKRNLS